MARYISAENCPQRSDLWFQKKLGKFSGSDFHIFLGSSQTREDALWEKVAERMFKDSDKDNFVSQAMERGIILEAEARRVYQAVTETKVAEVGLVEEDGEYDGWAVCSPDGLVGDDGIIEIKVPLTKNFLKWTDCVEGGERKLTYIRPEYETQINFNLFVCDRKWCDFVYYSPRGGIVITRYYRNDEKIAKIKEALDRGITFIKEKLMEI